MESENLLEQIELDEEFKDVFEWHLAFFQASNKYLSAGNLEKANQMSWEAELIIRTTQPNSPAFCLAPVESFEYFKSRVSTTNNPIHKVRYAEYLCSVSETASERYRFAQIAIDTHFELLSLCLINKREDAIYFSVEHIIKLVKSFKYRKDDALNKIVEITDELISEELFFWISRIIDVTLSIGIKNFSETSIECLYGQMEKTIHALREVTKEKFDKGKIALNYGFLRMILETKSNLCRSLKKQNEEWNTYFEIIQSYFDEAEICKIIGFNKTESYSLMAHCLEEAHKYIRQLESREAFNGFKARLAEVKNNVKREIINVNRIAHEASPSVEFSLEIPVEDVERVIKVYLEHDLKKSLRMLGYRVLVPIKHIQSKVKNSKTVFKLVYPYSTDKLGKTVAAPKTDKEVFEYELAWNVLSHIQENNIMVSLIFERLIHEKDLNTKRFMELLLESPVFSAMEETSLIRCGLDHYFKGDYLAAIHILCPQIEAAFRALLWLAGGSVTNPPRTSSVDASVQIVKSLEAILGDPYLKVLPDEFLVSARTVFTDPNGLNLRNNIAHGLLSAEDCTRNKVELILQAFLVLASLQEDTKAQEKK